MIILSGINFNNSKRTINFRVILHSILCLLIIERRNWLLCDCDMQIAYEIFENKFGDLKCEDVIHDGKKNLGLTLGCADGIEKFREGN